MKVPKNFIDPEHQSQQNSYSNPIWSRTALLQLIELNGSRTSTDELLTLYKKDEGKKEALSFRIKAMLRDKQIIQIKNNLYLPSFFPVRKGVVVSKNQNLMAKFFDDNTIVELMINPNQELYQGDICDFYCIGKQEKAFVCSIVKAHDIYVEGQLDLIGDYEVPPQAAGVLKVTKGPYTGQTICLYPNDQLYASKKNTARLIAKIDRQSSSDYIFASLAEDQFIPNNDIMNIVTQYHLPCTWPSDVLKETEKFSSTVRKSSSHEDLTNLNFVTIDGETAKDFDDAVYAEQVDGGYDLYVAIADVSSYVRPESSTDQEAAKRGVSVYFPKFVIPMLPEKLSNDLCSLRPQRLRKTLTCLIQIRNNDVSDYRFIPAVIRSKARLTYEQVQAHNIPKGLKKDIDNLWAVYSILKERRLDKGYLSFEAKSPSFKFNSNGKINDISYSPSLESCKLIEEMMLCANICAASFIKKSYHNQGVFRVHPEPLEEKVTSLNAFLEPYHIELKAPYTLENINRFSALLKEKVPQLSSLTARLMQRALYQTTPDLHFGLNEQTYTHFTSPIRRYPDLIVHRLIYQALKKDALEEVNFSTINNQLSEVNFLERRAEEAERLYHQILKVYFASSLRNKKLKATITGLASFGFFIECEKFPLEGLVPFQALGAGYCELLGGTVFCEDGPKFIIGQTCNVLIEEIDLENYRINFTLVR